MNMYLRILCTPLCQAHLLLYIASMAALQSVGAPLLTPRVFFELLRSDGMLSFNASSSCLRCAEPLSADCSVLVSKSSSTKARACTILYCWVSEVELGISDLHVSASGPRRLAEHLLHKADPLLVVVVCTEHSKRHVATKPQKLQWWRLRGGIMAPPRLSCDSM